MLELITHEGIPSGELRTEWELLVDRDPSATVFHTPRFLDSWFRILGDRAVPRVRSIHRDGALIGIIPEARELVGSPTGPVEVIGFLGGTQVTDYLGPVSGPHDRDEVTACYLEALAEEKSWDELVAAGLAADVGWAEALARHAKRLDLPVIEVEDHEVCPRISLDGGYDAYLGRLSGKQRHEVLRKARKLARDAGEFRIDEAPVNRLPAALDEFFSIAGETETAKGSFFRERRMREFFGALAETFGPDGVLRVHVLHIGDRPVAASVSLVHRATWGLYNSTFDAELRDLGPGMVLTGELIRRAAKSGMAVFDLLRGGEPYKYRFGAEDRALRRITIARR